MNVMSRIRIAGKSRNTETDTTPASKRVMKDVVAVYLFFMFAIYPLYYEDKYYNMGDAKWHFFKWVTLIAVILMFTVFTWYQLYLCKAGKVREYWDFGRTSLVDKAVLAYSFIVMTSFLLSPYKEYTLFGYDGWYMGLVSQLAFVIIYYFVSRFWRWDEIVLTIYLAVSAAVFTICVLNRFMIDPLEMYEGLSEQYIINFISTLGQATWFSSYMVLLFPIGLFAYWQYDRPVIHILSGVYVLLGTVTMIAQNSDSAIMAYGAIYLTLFCFSFKDTLRMQRFLECLILLFAGWKLMGILQMVYADRAVVLSGTMRTLSMGGISWAGLAVSVILLILYKRISGRQGFDLSRWKPVRAAVLIAVAALSLIVFVYIVLNTTGALAGTSFASDNNYLYFDEFWGNNRGSSWMVAAGTFLKSDLIRKLLGAGPDGFYNQVYRFYSDTLTAKWGENTVLTCAHNEWLNSLITGGILGFITYTGIFVTAMARFAKFSDDTPETIAPVLCIIGYMFHNFFCYQQIICTPIIFIIIGAGEAMCRYGRREIWEPDGDL